MVGDAVEKYAEISLRIPAVELCGADQGVDDRGPPAALPRCREQVGAKAVRPDRVPARYLEFLGVAEAATAQAALGGSCRGSLVGFGCS